MKVAHRQSLLEPEVVIAEGYVVPIGKRLDGRCDVICRRQPTILATGQCIAALEDAAQDDVPDATTRS
jgi:hypothetical protein